MGEPWILCVDDEPRILEGLELTLHPEHELVTATSPAEGLVQLEQRDGCGLVISDMRMPGTTGAAFLAEVRRRHPDITRFLLTGYSEMADAAAAVNEGGISRLLVKPCRPEDLQAAVADGLEQHRLRRAERELLEQTLNGTVQLLVEVLAIASPSAFERASVLRELVCHAAALLGIGPSWELEVAALLVRLGWISVPGELIDRYLAGQPLDPQQAELLESAPTDAAKLIATIPRLDPVARLVAAAGQPAAGGAEGELLRAALDVDRLMAQGLGAAGAVRQLHEVHRGAVLSALGSFRFDRRPTLRTLRLAELHPGMAVDEDVSTLDGKTLIRAGTELTWVLINRIQNFHATVGVVEPMRVLASAGPGSFAARAADLVPSARITSTVTAPPARPGVPSA